MVMHRKANSREDPEGHIEYDERGCAFLRIDRKEEKVEKKSKKSSKSDSDKASDEASDKKSKEKAEK